MDDVERALKAFMHDDLDYDALVEGQYIELRHGIDRYKERIEAVIAALQSAGWRRVGPDQVVVPREPAEDYIERLGNSMHSAEHSRSGETWPIVRSFYRAMLAASPMKQSKE